MPKSPAMKPFPWKCGRCRERSVVLAVVSYTTEIDHDGRTYSVTVPDLKIPRCSKCGAMIRDDACNRRISDALRQQIGLLTPEQIRRNREVLGLTQKQLAGMAGIAEATLSRWETGAQIQQRAMDRLLRVTFAFGAVRSALQNEGSVAALGASVDSSGTSLREREVDFSGPGLAAEAPENRRFVARLHSEGPQDAGRTARISRFVEALETLPRNKQESLLDEFCRLVELVSDEPIGAALK